MSYGRVSRVYAFCERLVFASRLQEARESCLNELEQCLDHAGARLLVVGGGDGRFLKALFERGLEPVIDYVEISQRMIDQASREVEGYEAAERVHWCCQSFEIWDEEGYDAVIAQFFIDGFEGADLENVLRKLVRAQGDEGVLLITDFDPQSSWWASLLVKLMQCFFWLTCGVPGRAFIRPDSWLESVGMVRQSEILGMGGLLFTTKWKKR
ncbi:hypothetical protein Rhal01_01765 [Rubritalea halochordaticola]|uniref:Methyltransferase type 12 domain-containing protein n=1 Tax=Rubritalea halochordaticola TaxID=714537 RepID=A0ABP9UYT1_9BACT